MSQWFSMDDTFECANCGKKGDRYTMEESVRRCGTGHGEWYCVDEHGCQTHKEVDTKLMRDLAAIAKEKGSTKQ